MLTDREWEGKSEKKNGFQQKLIKSHTRATLNEMMMCDVAMREYDRIFVFRTQIKVNKTSTRFPFLLHH